MATLRGIRGATTCDSNTKEAIVEATKELLGKLIESNDIDAADVAAAIFTTTQDLNAEFPSVAARRIGWDHVCPYVQSRDGGSRRAGSMYQDSPFGKH